MPNRRVIILVLVFFTLFVSGCADESGLSLKKVKKAYINNNFEKTLTNYYFANKDSDFLQIYSFTKDYSLISTLALQNLYDLKSFDFGDSEDLDNPFYFSILKTYYKNKNYIRTQLLDETSLYRDYFIAFNAAIAIDDTSLLSHLISKFKRTTHPNAIEFSEQVYKEIIDNIVYKKSSQISKNVIAKIKNYDFDLRFNIDNIRELNACLAYVTYSETPNIKNVINQIYEWHLDEDNQKFMLAQSEMYLSQYIENIIFCKKYLNKIKNDESFFYKIACEDNPLVFKGVIYELSSARNIFLYISGLTYMSQEVSVQQLNSLASIVNEKYKNIINSGDYASIYYLKLASSLLNLELNYDFDNIKKLDTNESDNSLKLYFKYKLENTKIDLPSSGDILSELLKLDLATNSKIVKKELKKISIFDYKKQDDFYVILNLYINLMNEYNLIDSQFKKTVKSYLKTMEGHYGYNCDSGNYDFAASIYYTNIMNILEGRIMSNDLR